MQSLLVAAWKDCIENDYSNQRINSERSLQASLWAHIYKRLPKNRRLFIEPSFSIKHRGQNRRLIPDIVICNTREVIAVIEIKYLPRGKPKYQKDLDSLGLVSRYRSKLSISNARFFGEQQDSKLYGFSKDVLFVWASVHKQDAPKKRESFAAGEKYLAGCYMQLHAETREGLKPDVFRVLS